LTIENKKFQLPRPFCFNFHYRAVLNIATLTRLLEVYITAPMVRLSRNRNSSIIIVQMEEILLNFITFVLFFATAQCVLVPVYVNIKQELS
jgi:hypothetical protein